MFNMDFIYIIRWEIIKTGFRDELGYVHWDKVVFATELKNLSEISAFFGIVILTFILLSSESTEG